MKRWLILAVTVVSLSIAYTANVPDVKEGLWSVHTTTINNPGNQRSEGTYTLCRNHAFDEAVLARAKNMKNCTIVHENMRGSEYSTQTHCVIGSTVIETKGTVTFQADTAFHSESHGTYTPAMGGISDMTIIMDQKYIGSCPAGQQPGDQTNADGTVMHLGKR
jgi:hypothetical protein